MADIHTYRAFGLTIASVLPFPELVEADGSPELEVAYDSVPSRLPDVVRSGVRFQVAPGKVLVVVDDVARYLIHGGTQILVDREAGAPDDSVRLFLLGSVFAAALHQRGVLALGASAVATPKGSAAFLGLSGAGKSTLAAGLRARGYRVLTDDLCAVSFRDGRPMVWPAYPRLKLWPNALERLDVEAGPLPRVRPELEKRALALGDSFEREPRALGRVFVLRGSPSATRVSLEPVEGHHVVGAIGIHTYASQFLEGLGTEMAYFENVSKLLAAAPIHAITRPIWPFALDELLDCVEGEVRP